MHNRQSIGSLIFRYLVMLVALLFALLPIISVVFTSFKTKMEFVETSPLTAPDSFMNFSNYVYAWEQGGFTSAFLNTILLLGVSLFVSINCAAMIGYVLHRFNFKGKNVLRNMFLFTMFIPTVTTQVIVYQMIYAMGLNNTLFAPMLLYLGVDIIAIYIMIQAFESVPKSIDESGIMDGAGYITVYRKLIFPLLKPAIASLVVIKGIAIYNDFYIPNLYLLGETQTVATALYKFTGGLSTPWQVVSAAVIIVMIPTVVLFVFLQKWFYSGFTSGAVK